MENRILIYAPTGQDAALASKMLTLSKVDNMVVKNASELSEQLLAGAGAVLTVEEALSPGGIKALGDHVQRQPGWSDLPVMLLTHRGPDSPGVRRAIAALGNVTLLERPVRTLTLITSLQSVLRARAKQYQVRETDRRKDEFLASLGHELRNPLAPIRTSMGVLTHLYPQQPPITKVSEVIERQVTHLTRLVGDLLDVARINSGKIELQPTHVTFAAIINHVVELCAAAAAAKRIRIELALPHDDIRLFADYARVVQIVANIVTNAVKFTPEDGHIRVHAQVVAGCLEISVSDSGIGLDAAAVGRIFTMLEQSRPLSGQIRSGLGIGLSLSRQFAEMHGGSVHARSDGPGKGSEFIVKLPVVSSVAAPGPREAGLADLAEYRPRVLVVDDNRDAADSLQFMFEMEHCDVDTAYDGHAAVRAVELSMPDMIVMDLGMPSMHGYEAARRIRRHPGSQAVLMIALTGWGQSDARQRTIEAGFDHHLVKPVNFDEIRQLASARLPKGAALRGAL
ncbi:hybrid sensor histidine kinase/response regulator [Massilia glaciei]|uniref:histidine kinase n=1 Tax=Massilia glaciei TaxID=1524097 RepID=A0A2U2HFJ0_9BURK|nr:response regulator [Massilia glaciei]PWF43084.1 hybrid sensor histidine kinase/response regulator [Massilia glaciei]